MKYDKYKPLFVSNDGCEYRFCSDGPKGEIQKVVQFTLTDDADIYNLSFGDLTKGGEVDDCITNDNKDRNKILATVASTIYEFTGHYPDKYIFFTGSTPERIRLYRMVITNNLEELCKDYEIYGVQWDNGEFVVEPFIKGQYFFGFIIKRRNH